MKKFKILLGPILAIVLCISLIAGATYALFTSKSKTNIAVSSGEVNVIATAEIAEAWSAVWDESENGYVPNNELTRITNGFEFTNKGTAVYEDGTLMVKNISPGDGLRLAIEIVNRSAVKTKYRIEVASTQQDGLLDMLAISYALGDKQIEFNGSNPRFTDWFDLEKANDAEKGDTINTLNVDIELPFTVSEDYQNKSCNLVITVFAVQWNGDVEDPAASTVTASTTIGEYANANYWSGNSRYTKIQLDDVVTLTTSEGDVNGTYDKDNLSWNLYQSENATLTISVPAGYELESFTITYSNNNTGGVLRVDSEAVKTYALRAISADYDVKSGVKYLVSDSNKGNDVTLVVSGDGIGEVHITDVEVVYRANENVAECEHEWNTDNILWNWAEDNSAAKATFKCSKCDKTRTATAAVSSSVEKEASCTEDGKKVYTATVKFEGKTYKDTKEVTLDKFGHALQDVEKKEATCTESGYEAHKACSRCDYKESYAEIPAKGHNYIVDKWNWSGDYTNAVVTLELKCANDENHVYTVTEKEYIELNLTQTTPATCSATGTATWTAKVNYNKQTFTEDNNYEIPVDPNAHTKVVHEVVPATCEKDGNKLYYECSACQKLFSDEAMTKATSLEEVTLKASGHDWDLDDVEWSWNTDYTIATATFTCANDGEHKHVATAVITKEEKTENCSKSIVYTATVTVEFGVGTYQDQKTVALDGEYHSFGEWHEEVPATCVSTGTKGYKQCTVCNLYFDENDTKIEDITIAEDPNAHTQVVHEAKDATCEKDGNKSYYECSACQKLFSDEAMTQETSLEEVTLKALGHDWKNATARWEFNYAAKTATATITCGREDCEHSVEVTDEQIKEETKTAADCEHDRTFYYTASVEYEGETFATTDTELQTEENSKLGHDWTNVQPEWSWNEGHTVATATFTCARGCGHTEPVEDKNPTSNTTQATCEVSSKTTYSAKVNFQDKDFTTEEVVDNDDALGHDWKNATATWEFDYIAKTATATITCGREDCEHFVTETDRNLGEAEVSAADCENDRTFYYTASVEYEGETFATTDTVRQTQENSATGHSYNLTFESEELDGTHWNECSECGYKDESSIAQHEFTEWEAIGDEHISECVCGAIYIGNHDNDIKLEGEAATCTQTGLSEGAKCSVCGEIVVEQKTISALNHNWVGDWISDENGQHYQKCERYDDCKTTSDPVDCSDFGEYTNLGDKHSKKCSDCGYVTEDKHTWSEEATSAEEIGHTFTCTAECGATKTDNHALAYENIGDDYNHRTYCTVEGCGYESEQPHDFGSGDNRHNCDCGEPLCGEQGTVELNTNLFDENQQSINAQNKVSYYNEGSMTISGIDFAWIGLGHGGDDSAEWTQWRTNTNTGTSQIWNTQAFAGNITNISFVWYNGTATPKADVSTGHLKIELANDAEFTEVTTKYVVLTTGTVEFAVDGSYTFVRISHTNNGGVYLANIVITYGVGTHVWDTVTRTEEATCKHGNLTIYTCIRCGAEKVEDDGNKADNHVFTEDADTKYENGGKIHSTQCSVCNEYIEHETNYINRGEAGHAMSCDTCHWKPEADHVYIDNQCVCGDKPSYEVTLEYGEGGTATATHTGSVEADTEVTVTITPAEGYKLASLKVNDEDVTDEVQDNTYTFVVAGITSIVVTFAEDKVTQEIWDLVTDVSVLAEGSQIIITYGTNVMGKSSDKTTSAYRLRVVDGIETNGNTAKILKADDVAIITLEASSNVNGAWALSTNEGYLYWSSGNTLPSTQSSTNKNASWTIAIDNATTGTAIIKNQNDTSRLLQYNSASSGLRFAAYAGTQNNPVIYILRGTEAKVCEHTGPLEHTDEVAATCTEAGVASYYKCTECGKYFEDENGELGNIINDLEAWKKDAGLTQEALGHEKPTEAGKYTKADGTHSYTCSRCEEPVIENHKYDDHDYTCICGDSLVEKVAEAFAQIADSINNITIAESPYQLPQLSVTDVEFEWSVDEGESVDVDIDQNGQLTVKQFPEADTTITIKLTATCGAYSETKDVTVTIVGRPAAGGEHKCGDVCEVCGGCLTNCEEPECAKKCDCKLVWTKVTKAADLKVNDKIIIVNNDKAMGASSSNGNNRTTVIITNNGDTVNVGTAAIAIITLVEGKVTDTFGFKVDDGYLAAGSSSSNYLNTKQSLDANGSWKITISASETSIVAQGSFTRNSIRYNTSSNIFACYASGQLAVTIYKQVKVSSGGGTTEPEPHVCTSICPTCKKCTNTTCQEDICKNNQCEGHNSEVTPGQTVTVTLKSTLSGGNMSTTENNAKSVGLDANIFTVLSSGGSPAVGTYSELRLYKSNTLSVSAKNVTILSIKVTIVSTSYNPSHEVKAGDTVVTGTINGLVEEYTINDGSFSITNQVSSGSTQLRITSIEITYKLA